MPFRTLKTRMFYSKPEFQTKETPKPFCEFRVWIITEKPIPFFPEIIFDEFLDRLEFIFFSVKEAREQNTIYYIEGREDNRRISMEEALEYLARTGLKKPKFDIPYRQAHFWLSRGREAVYNEADIRRIMRQIKFTPRIYARWKRRLTRLGRFDEDIKGLSMEELEAML